MANKNPNPATRFSSDRQPATKGRPRESRDRLSRAFLQALADDFEQHGAKVIERTRREDTAAYLRVVASLMPKELEISRPEDGLTDAQLESAIEILKELIEDKETNGRPAVRRLPAAH